MSKYHYSSSNKNVKQLANDNDIYLMAIIRLFYTSNKKKAIKAANKKRIETIT